MSENEISPEFWERADQVIALANEQVKEATVGTVSSSLLYAAAKFNAFNVASSADDVDEMIHDKEETIRYFTEQYRKMLIENLDEYIASYQEYKPYGKS